MRSVTAGGPGMVAVGHDHDEAVAAVWVSADGLNWERIAHDEGELGGSGSREMEVVAAIGAGLVAVGIDCRRDAAAVWWSPDGLQWERVARDSPVFSGEGLQWMNSITECSSGLVAVGRDEGRDAAAVWASVDGLAWERLAHQKQAFGGNTEMRSVTAGSPGLVAVGHDLERAAAAVWASADGSVWERMTHREQVFGGSKDEQEMWSVAVGGPGLVAVGGNWRRSGTAWHWAPPGTRETTLDI